MNEAGQKQKNGTRNHIECRSSQIKGVYFDENITTFYDRQTDTNHKDKSRKERSQCGSCLSDRYIIPRFFG